MRLKTIQQALLLGGIALSSMAWAGPSSEMLANTCAGCHGTHGNSMGPAAPTIAGLSHDYFVETMLAYNQAERPSTIMARIAKGYTEDEIVAMADYFSEQAFVAGQQSFDSKLAKRGKKLHKKYCERCHTEGGSLKDDDAGILAGQWMPYLHYTLEDFTGGARDMPRKMKKALKRVKRKAGDKGYEQLLHYYASQQ